MNISDLFARLSYGELSNLTIGMDGAGTIAEASQDRIASHVGNALREIYTRLSHKRDYVKISLSAGQGRYLLSGVHALSNTDPANMAPRFILDSVLDPFQDDVVLILSTKLLDNPATPDTMEARMLGLGGGSLQSTVQDDRRKLLVPTAPLPVKVEMLAYNELMIRNPQDGQVVEIEYQAGHKPISVPVDLDQEIQISPALEAALELHVASQIFSAMSGEAFTAKAQSLLTRFDQQVALAKDKDLVGETITDPDDFDRLHDKGFV